MPFSYSCIIKTPVCHLIIAKTAQRIAKKVVGRQGRHWAIESRGKSSLLLSFTTQDDLSRFSRVWRSASGEAPSVGNGGRR